MKANLSDVGIAAVRLLEALSATADFNPILKSVAGGALHVAKLIESFKSNTKAWAQFAEHVQKNVALIAQSIADKRADSDFSGLQKGLDDLNQVLIRMSLDIEQMQRGNAMRRAVAFVKDPKKIEDMQRDFDKAIQLFHLNAEIHIGEDVSRILQDIQSNSSNLPKVVQSLGNIEANQRQMATALRDGGHAATLMKLPYAQGATWSKHQMCYPDTRKLVLGEIQEWVANFQAPDHKRSFCLTGAPGAGKTAIAHSVSQICAENDWLVTAFFFSRENSTRSPMLISTIACDLAARFPGFQVSISQAIDRDPSLASAGPSRQFGDLILPFASRLPQDKPIVIVLDALDEGYTKEIIKVLWKDICQLPSNILLFMTTREIEGVKMLLKADHVYHRRFYHHGEQELEDVALVAQDSLAQIAMTKDLDDWPTEKILKAMVARSQGLMIWVVTVCQYLEEVPDPEGDLQTILEREQPDDQGVEEKMDELYALILLGFKWSNKTFVKGYDQVMGTILASKVPLSANAIKSLLAEIVQLPNVLQLLKPLLLPSGDGEPIQVLHQSLYDLLIERAHTKETWKHFSINKSMQSQKLALLCLHTISKEFSEENTKDLGHISFIDRSSGFIKLKVAVPEHLQYACKFWMDHILDTEDLSEEVINALIVVLDSKFTQCLELLSCIGQIKSMTSLVSWIDNHHPDLRKNLQTQHIAEAWTTVSYSLTNENRRNEALIAAEQSYQLLPDVSDFDNDSKSKYTRADALLALSQAQSNMGMMNDALKSAKDAERMFKVLAEDNPEAYNPDLALSLNNLGNILSNMGLRKDALQPSQDAVEIYRTLAHQSPNKFNLFLAKSLNNLSIRLSKMGEREEALKASKEAVEIREKLVGQNPNGIMPELGRSLINLGIMLSDMGQKDEALAASRRSVEVFKVLSENNPNTFKPEFAAALHNLAMRLSDANMKEEAMQTSRNAVDLYKDLVEQNPVAFHPELARSLDNLGITLSGMGLREEALQASQEAVDLQKKLAEQDPVAFSPDLTKYLYNLCLRLSEMNLMEEALQACKDAVDILKKLTEEDPDAFKLDLAKYLSHLSKRLSEMNHKEEALQASKEAVTNFRELADVNETTFNPLFGRSLESLSIMLMQMGLQDEELQTSKELVDVRRKLAEQNPPVHNPDLASSLHNLSLSLSEMGSKEEALEISKQAVDIYKKLAEQNSDVFNQPLAAALVNLSVHLKGMGLKEDALQAAREVVDIQRDLAEKNPGKFNLDLTKSLHNLSVFLNGMGMNDEALASIKQAIEIWELLTIQHPGAIFFKLGLFNARKFLAELEGGQVESV